MKNKKGFTLIEIIVSLTLIALIVTISIVLVNKNSKKEYSEITKNIIRAASVYIATEKDDNGNTYEYGITHGAKGAQISVKTLYDKGYIDESTLKTLETNYKIAEDKTYLIQVTNSIKVKDAAECKSNVLNYTVNWENTTDTVYLCPYDETTSNSKVDNINPQQLFDTKFDFDANKIPISEENYNKLSTEEKEKYSTESGMYLVGDYESGKNVFYGFYRGVVNNNYIKINDKLWRILWYNTNKEMKLVLDEAIPITFKDVNGKIYSTEPKSGEEKLNNLYYIKYDTDGSSKRVDFKWVFLLNGDFIDIQEGKFSVYSYYLFGNLLNATDSEKFSKIDSKAFHETIINEYLDQVKSELPEKISDILKNNPSEKGLYGYNEEINNFRSNMYSQNPNILKFQNYDDKSSKKDIKINYMSASDLLRAYGFKQYAEKLCGSSNSNASLTNTYNSETEYTDSFLGYNFMVNNPYKTDYYYGKIQIIPLSPYVFTKDENNINIIRAQYYQPEKTFKYGYHGLTYSQINLVFNGHYESKLYLCNNSTCETSEYYGAEYTGNQLQYNPIYVAPMMFSNLKPTIILDMSKNKLNGDGTKDNPYTIE